MAKRFPSAPESLPLAAEELLGPICQRFEEAWHHGPPPSFRPFLDEVPEAWRSALLTELLRLDVAFRAAQGEQPTLAAYLAAYPDLEAALQSAFRPAPDSSPTDDEVPPLRDHSWGGDLPTAVGRFRIVRELGRGGMGIVYEAVQEPLGRHVALKVMTVRHRGPAEVERFRREAAVASRLHHTNIVPVFEAGEAGGTLYYAMQYIAGRNLHEAIADRLSGLAAAEVLTPRRVAEIGLQAASALAYAHDQGVVHRDIKPSNLLLDDHGRVWITDFGLVKTAESGLTATGDILGTLRYLAPERLQGHCDARADVYALGLSLYELLTLQPAFPENEQGLLLEAIAHREPPPPRRAAPEVPRDLETVVLKAIHKEPERRYPTCAAFTDDLRRFLAGEPVRARPARWPERLWLWGKRHPLPAAGLGFFLAGLLATTASALWTARQAVVHAAELEQALTEKGRSETAARKAEGEARAESAAKSRALRRADGLRLVAQSELVRSQNPALALLLALEGADRVPGLLANNAVQNALDECRELRVFRGHGGSVFSAALSGDGTRVLTAGAEGTAQIWDAATGEALHVLAVPDLVQAHFSPDGRRVVTLAGAPEFRRFAPFPVAAAWAPWDVKGPRVALWDAATGRLVARWQPPPPARPPVFAHAAGVAFRPDSRRVVTFFACHPDGHPLVHDTETGRQVARLAGPAAVLAAVYSPDGITLATASADNAIRLWNAETGAMRDTLTGHKGGVGVLRFSPDGGRLLSVGAGYSLSLEAGAITSAPADDAPARHWDTGTAQQLPPLAWPDTSRVPWSTGGYTADGRTVVLANAQYGRRLWDAATGRPQIETGFLSPGLGFPVTVTQSLAANVALAPGGTSALVTGLDSAAYVLTPTGLVTLRGHDGKVESASCSADGRLAVTASADGTARLWRLPGPGLPLADRLPSWPAEITSLSRDGGRLFLVQAGSPPSLLIDTRTGAPLVSYDTYLRGAFFLANGTEAAVVIPQPGPGGEVTRIDVIDIATGRPTASTPGPPGHVLAVGPDGRFVLTTPAGLPTASLAVWERVSGKKVADLPVKASPLVKPTFSPDGRHLLVADSQGTPHLTVWDAATGEERRRIRDAGPCFWWCAPLDGDRRLLGYYADTGEPFRVFDPATEALVLTCSDRTLRPPDMADGPATAYPRVRLFRVSPDGRTLAASPYRNRIGLWDLETGGEPRASLVGHGGEISCVAFSPAGDLVVTGSEDRTARLWDVATGALLAVCRGHEGTVTAAAIAPDRRRLVTTGLDRTVRLWDVATGVEVARLPWFGRPADDVTFAPDGRRVVVRGPSIVHLWDSDVVAAARARRPRDLTPEEMTRFEIHRDGDEPATAGR